METLTPDVLESILKILVDKHVREFSGLGIHVRFAKDVVDYDQKSDRVAPPVVKSQWEDPGLWPGGKPPVFPGKDR